MSPTKAHAAQDNDLTAGSPAITTQDQSYSYKVGTTRSGSVSGNSDLYYNFSVGSATGIDARIWVKNTGSSGYFYADLLNSSGSKVWDTYSIDPGESQTGSRVYLPKGNYRLKIYTYQYYSWYGNNDPTKFSFNIKKLSQTLMSFAGSNEMAEKNLKIAKNTQPKVASASISNISNHSATLTITPKKMGVTTIKVKLGGQVVKFIAYVKNGYAFIAKGAVSYLEKPIGTKVKYVYKKAGAAKSKKIAGLTSTGKIRGKIQGRAAVAGKTAKGTVFNYTVVVTDYKKLGRETYNMIAEYVPDPDSIKINYCYRGYYKLSTTLKVPVVYLDYSFGNESGGKTRNKIISWYDDALDVQTRGIATSNTIIGKKGFSFR